MKCVYEILFSSAGRKNKTELFDSLYVYGRIIMIGVENKNCSHLIKILIRWFSLSLSLLLLIIYSGQKFSGGMNNPS